LSCTLQFTYTPKYPEEPPEIEVLDECNFDDGPRLTEHLEEVVSFLIQKTKALITKILILTNKAQENLGMVMVFTLVSAAQEWLSNLSDELQNQKEEVERKKKDAEDEAERVIL
jgi:RWD domain